MHDRIDHSEVRRLIHLGWVVSTVLAAYLVFGGLDADIHGWVMRVLVGLLAFQVAVELSQAPMRWPLVTATANGIALVMAFGVIELLTGGAGGPFALAMTLVTFGCGLLLTRQATVLVVVVALALQLATAMVLGEYLTAVTPALATVLAAWLGWLFAGDHQRQVSEAGSLTDPITGLFSEASFRATHRREHHQALRYARHYGLMLVRVADYQDARTRHGDEAAKHMIAATGQMLSQLVRDSDALGRWGADGFAMIFVYADREATEVAVKRITMLLDKVVVGLEEETVKPRFAIAHAVYPADGTDPFEMFESAIGRIRVR